MAWQSTPFTPSEARHRPQQLILFSLDVNNCMVVCTHCGAENDDVALTCKGCGTSIVSVLAPQPRARLLVRGETMLERIRCEVDAEFDAPIQQATGLQKWWLIMKREQEIFRRHLNLIYASFAA